MGAVLIQKQDDGTYRPVTYASRALTLTEQRYAQVEKEGLAVTWACERFRDYLIGIEFHIETDHKPLVSLFGKKNLDELTPRIQRFRMRLMGFKYSISHLPGKDLITADALSIAPVTQPSRQDDVLTQEVQAFVDLVISSFPSTQKMLNKIKSSQENDPTCQEVKRYCELGWPVDKKAVSQRVKPYFQFSQELVLINGLLARGTRIIIPPSLRQEMLQRLHTGHQGITKCRERARESIWWPGLATELETLVGKCTICIKERQQPAEPLRPSEFPQLPWQKVATDLFELKSCTYLLVIDYFSLFMEIAPLKGTTSADVILHLKSIFARHGIPETVYSDNGPQYSSHLFKEFARDYQFIHITSSPKFPQSNGEAERAVKTVKNLLKKSEDPYLALLAYRTTPLQCGYSPSELLMSRKLRNTIPMLPPVLQPKVPDYTAVYARESSSQEQQATRFNQRHKAKSLCPLNIGQSVWITDCKCQGQVTSKEDHRSYWVSLLRGKSYEGIGAF